MNRSVECVFAEYQKELLEHYDVFAIEAGYESGTYSEQNLLDRLSYYGADMENDIKRIRLFTDQNGELFMDQAGKYMKHKYGISWADKYLGSTSIWKNQERQADEITREEKAQTDRLEELLSGQEMELPGEENPLEHVAGLKQAPILNLVLPKETQVSEKQVVSESQRRTERIRPVTEHLKMWDRKEEHWIPYCWAGIYRNILRIFRMNRRVGAWTMKWNIFWLAGKVTGRIWKRLRTN